MEAGAGGAPVSGNDCTVVPQGFDTATVNIPPDQLLLKRTVQERPLEEVITAFPVMLQV
jgi:hypothetical protein